MSIEERLNELNIKIPEVAKPVAAYVPAVLQDGFIFTSGQIPVVAGKPKYTGIVGKDVSLDEAVDAARVCCLNALAAVKSMAGSLENIERIVKITGFVASAPEFTDQAKVMNGASEMLGDIFGGIGKHARSAVGTCSLPLNVPVEIEMIVKIKN